MWDKLIMLYIVSTPIGNLSDLTFRVKEILEKVDFILAEDTRQSRKILARFGIGKRIMSFHEYSSPAKLERLAGELKKGRELAYLTDAGTPNLSDPGSRLCEKVLAEGLKVTPLPGPSALTALISVAPFSCAKFLFLGFFPKGGREKIIAEIEAQKHPVFFFESPYRIKKTLDFLRSRLSDTRVLVGRELTKKFEEIVYCDLADSEKLLAIKNKGEFVVGLVRRPRKGIK